MNKLFDVAQNVSTPLALAGLFAAIFFLLLKIILQKSIYVRQSKESTKQILFFVINKIFILAICSMILGFIGYVINIYRPEIEHNPINQLNIDGIVLMNNKELEGVTVKVLEIEKTDITNSFGRFSFSYITKDSIRKLTITFKHPKTTDCTEIFSNSLYFRNIRVNLRSKTDDTTYLILSGKIVNTTGDPISNVSITTLDGEYKTTSDMNGFFKLESKRKIFENELRFWFYKEGYKSKDEYFYVNTKNLRLILDEKN